MKEFTPDTATEFVFRNLDSMTAKKTVPAESITLCGGVIVITHYGGKGLGATYGLTHRLTGYSVTGSEFTYDLVTLKQVARRFWRSLTKDEREIWKKSSDPVEVAKATSAKARKELPQFRI